jgi:molybdate transport system substrate-binding protein
MTTWSKITTLASACALTLVIGAHSAVAAEITVLSNAGPMPEVLGTFAKMFEQSSGHKVKLEFKGAPAIAKDLKEGARVDLVVQDPGMIDDLIKDGLVAGGSTTRIMLSRIGVAVKAGAPKPNIATPEGLKAALVSAKTVGYSQGASGQHFLTVIQRLGLTDVIKPKAVVVQGRPVGAAVASGEAEIGVQQVAELLPVQGIDLLGPLPGDLQKILVYSTGIPTKAKEADAARALVRFITSEANVAKLKQMGMEPAI